MANRPNLWHCFPGLSAAARSFRDDRRGNVAIIFGIALVPIIGLIGFAIDFSRATAVQAELNATADAAALGAVSVSNNPNLITPSSTEAKQRFDATVATLSGVTLKNVTVTSTRGISAVGITVNYSASVSTFFGGLFGISTLQIGGHSSASRNLPTYANFYLLLDNSPSMGLAATTSDISHMQALTPDGCAFACHQHSFDSKGNITGDNLNDYYHIAKNNAVTTRIDVLRTATQQLTSTAQKSATVTAQYQMGVYTFSDTFQTVANLSPDMSSVSSQAGAIDLAYAYYDQRDTQTSYNTALKYMNKAMPNPGTGSSVVSPQEYLFLVTDGVVDEPVGSKSGSGDAADGPATYQSLNSQPNLQNSASGNVNSTRLITTLDPALCQAIKDRGITIAVLYTTYLPVTTNGFYNQWVKPISSNIPTSLKSCASTGFYFEVTPSQGIADAMQTMFASAVAKTRLTQ